MSETQPAPKLNNMQTRIIAGAVGGAILVRRADRTFPWDAVGLALTALLFAGPAPLTAVGWVGFGLGISAGLARLADGDLGGDGGAAWPAAALAVAALVLGFQVLLPALSLVGAPGVQVPVIAATTLAVAAALLVLMFLAGRRRAA